MYMYIAKLGCTGDTEFLILPKTFIVIVGIHYNIFLSFSIQTVESMVRTKLNKNIKTFHPKIVLFYSFKKNLNIARACFRND